MLAHITIEELPAMLALIGVAFLTGSAYVLGRFHRH